MSGIKLFFLLWAISVAIMYFQFAKPGQPLVLPGDIYTKKTGKTLYIPLGSSFFLAIILRIILKLLLKF